MKKQKRYRYRKTTPEILEKMKEEKKKGLTYKQVSTKFGIHKSCVQYWLDPKIKTKTIKKAQQTYNQYTPKQKKEKTIRQAEYQKKYMHERYNNDEEFKKRVLEHDKKSFKKRSKEWRKQGLCTRCGREKINKQYKLNKQQYKLCGMCREKHRKNWRKNEKTKTL